MFYMSLYLSVHLFIYFLFTFLSGLCSLCPALSPILSNVTTVIKNFQQGSLWRSAWRCFWCVFFSVCGRGVPTVLYASSVLGPNSRFGIRIRSIVFPCTFSIALTSVSSTISIALTSEHSQLYFHVQCTFSIALRSGQSQMYSHVHSHCIPTYNLNSAIVHILNIRNISNEKITVKNFYTGPPLF